MYASILSATLAIAFLVAVAECYWADNDNDFHRIRAEQMQYSTSRAEEKRYTENWAVEIAEGGDEIAEKIAGKHGFRNMGKVRASIIVQAYYHNVVVIGGWTPSHIPLSTARKQFEN